MQPIRQSRYSHPRTSDDAAVLAENEEVPEEVQAIDNESFVSEEFLPPQEEKQDLKIALGSKKIRQLPNRSH